MCSRYILVTTSSTIENRFGLPLQTIPIEANYNIQPGQYVPVITCEKRNEIQLLKFGLTPFWAKTEMNLYNARAEGDSNTTDIPSFRGAKGIIQKKAFRKAIRSQRCIVLASAFIASTSFNGITKTFLIYLRNHVNPFAMAGLWDTWLNLLTGESTHSFSIITTTANSLVRMTDFKRMPVILSDSEAKKWINPATELSRITAMLNPYESNLMNAYPINNQIIKTSANTRQLILPIGEKLVTEDISKPMLQTRGYYQSKQRANTDTPLTMAEMQANRKQE